MDRNQLATFNWGHTIVNIDLCNSLRFAQLKIYLFLLSFIAAQSFSTFAWVFDLSTNF